MTPEPTSLPSLSPPQLLSTTGDMAEWLVHVSGACAKGLLVSGDWGTSPSLLHKCSCTTDRDQGLEIAMSPSEAELLL
jgi:hypothetical protein